MNGERYQNYLFDHLQKFGPLEGELEGPPRFAMELARVPAKISLVPSSWGEKLTLTNNIM